MALFWWWGWQHVSIKSKGMMPISLCVHSPWAGYGIHCGTSREGRQGRHAAVTAVIIMSSLCSCQRTLDYAPHCIHACSFQSIIVVNTLFIIFYFFIFFYFKNTLFMQSHPKFHIANITFNCILCYWLKTVFCWVGLCFKTIKIDRW